MATVVAALGGAISGLFSWLLLRYRQPGLVTAPSHVLTTIAIGSCLCTTVAVTASDDQTAVVAVHLTTIAIPLALVDALTMKLPLTVVYGTYPSTVVALIAATPNCSLNNVLGWSLAAATFTAALYAFALTGGLGAGDVKLAPVLGAHLGWAGWSTLLTGLILSFLIGALLAIILIATRSAGVHDRMPFAPALLIGAIVALLV